MRWAFTAVWLVVPALVGCAPVATTTAPPATAGSNTVPAPTSAASRDVRHECLGAGQVELPTWHHQEVDHFPEVIQRIPPNYPDIALEAGIDGIVRLYVLVCADGSVRETRISKSIPMLDAAAMESVRQWSYRPASRGNEPVAAWFETQVEFRLPRREGRDVR